MQVSPTLVAILVTLVVASAGPQAMHCLADRFGISSMLDDGRPFAVGMFVAAAMLMGMAVGIPMGYALGQG